MQVSSPEREGTVQPALRLAARVTNLAVHGSSYKIHCRLGFSAPGPSQPLIPGPWPLIQTSCNTETDRVAQTDLAWKLVSSPVKGVHALTEWDKLCQVLSMDSQDPCQSGGGAQIYL